MKRIVCTMLVVLGWVAMSAAQSGTAPAPASGFQISSSQRKAPPAAKTTEENTAYLAIRANLDLAAARAAAKDFEAKFPQSELTSAIYEDLMDRYRRSNDAQSAMEMGRKVLQSDTDNPMVLVTVASVLAERTKPTDLDRDQKLTEAAKDAQHALDTMDDWLAKTPRVTDEQAKGIKPILASMAQAALGLIEDVRKNPAEAEKHYQASVELNTVQPEPITWLRLALARDAQKKYAEALIAANRAVELSVAEGGMVAEYAKQEQARLAKLTGQMPPAPPAAPATPPKS